MEVITDDQTDVVQTEGRPIVPADLSADLDCHSCEWIGPLSECGQWVPGGHGKWVAYKCPECDTRIARKKGSNRYVDEDFVDMSIDDAFEAKFDEDATLLPGGEVDVDMIGEEITEVVIFHPDQGTFERHEIEGVYTEPDSLREAGMAYAAPSLLSDEVPAGVVFADSFKPIGYDTDWDEGDEDFKPGEANKTVLRFVREE